MLRPKRLPRGYSCIIIGVVYHPPDANNNDMLVYLRTSMEYIEANYTNYGIILLGDFNKLDFKRDAKCFQLKPIVKFPTRGSNTLDQIFTNLEEFYCLPVPGPPFGLSDHITVTIFPAVRKRPQTQTKVVKSRDKRPSNVASLGRFLLNIPWESLLLPHQSSEDKLSLVTQMINYGLNTIMPERSVKIHVDDCPWITKDLKRLILQRQKAFTAGKMSLFKFLRNKVNRERKRCRKSYYKAKVQQLSDSKPHDWWREVKQLCGLKTEQKNLRSILRINCDDNDQDLSNRINETFISIMNSYSALPEDLCFPNDGDECIQVTVDSVTEKLRQIDKSKASGPDNLPAWLLKTYADILAPAITDVLNSSFLEGKVPSMWKIANIAPLPKAQDIEDFNKDLRPIALTPTLSKIAEEYIIQNELKPKLLNIIDPNQFGFIPGSSTKFALISMLHKWLAATDGTSSMVRVILLDFKKAFDLVDHNILVEKLYSYGIKPTVLNWIVDFLRNRYQRVKIDSNCFSDFLHVPAGVPQGTKLGPWLFLAMINDLKLSNDPLEDMWKYADDSTISEVVPMSNNSALQLIVDEAVGWSDRNKLQLHPTKCKEFRIQFSKREYIAEPIIISGQQLEIVKSAKILGVTLTDDLRWNKHIGTVVSKASKRLYLLKQLQRAGVDEHHLIDFYNACIRSVVEYACEVFHSSLPTYLSEELERVQRRAMRIIFPGMKYKEALQQGHLQSLYDRREYLCTKLFRQIEQDPCHKLKTLLPNLNTSVDSLRTVRKYTLPLIKTDRFKNSFIPSQASKIML